jgi:hypothetical protein
MSFKNQMMSFRQKYKKKQLLFSQIQGNHSYYFLTKIRRKENNRVLAKLVITGKSKEITL